MWNFWKWTWTFFFSPLIWNSDNLLSHHARLPFVSPYCSRDLKVYGQSHLVSHLHNGTNSINCLPIFRGNTTLCLMKIQQLSPARKMLLLSEQSPHFLSFLCVNDQPTISLINHPHVSGKPIYSPNKMITGPLISPISHFPILNSLWAHIYIFLNLIN